MLLVAALFAWSEFFPSWLIRVIVVTAILFPPLAYLTVLARSSIRQAWRDVLLDSWALIVSAVMALARIFRPATVMRLVRVVVSLKPMPTTVDEWLTCCVLPFKTCIVATLPMIWVFQKFTAHFRPYGRFQPSYELIFQCYLISLLALLFGALLQAVFCRAGRATTTLRFFLLGFVLIFISAFTPRLSL